MRFGIRAGDPGDAVGPSEFPVLHVRLLRGLPAVARGIKNG